MDTSIITKAEQFDESCLSFAERSYTTPTSAKLVSFMYKNQVLLVQTPVLMCPLGFRPFDTKNDRQTLLVNVDASMIDVFKKIDNAIMTNIMEHSSVWFEKLSTMQKFCVNCSMVQLNIRKRILRIFLFV